MVQIRVCDVCMGQQGIKTFSFLVSKGTTAYSPNTTGTAAEKVLDGDLCPLCVDFMKKRDWINLAKRSVMTSRQEQTEAVKATMKLLADLEATK